MESYKAWTPHPLFRPQECGPTLGQVGNVGWDGEVGEERKKTRNKERLGPYQEPGAGWQQELDGHGVCCVQTGAEPPTPGTLCLHA